MKTVLPVPATARPNSSPLAGAGFWKFAKSRPVVLSNRYAAPALAALPWAWKGAPTKTLLPALATE